MKNSLDWLNSRPNVQNILSVNSGTRQEKISKVKQRKIENRVSKNHGITSKVGHTWNWNPQRRYKNRKDKMFEEKIFAKIFQKLKNVKQRCSVNLKQDTYK